MAEGVALGPGTARPAVNGCEAEGCCFTPPAGRRAGSWPAGAFCCLGADDGPQVKSSCRTSGTRAISPRQHLLHTPGHAGSPHHSLPPAGQLNQRMAIMPHANPRAGLSLPAHPQALGPPTSPPPLPHQPSGPKMQLEFLLPSWGMCDGQSSLGNNTSLLIFSSLLISKSFK